MIRVLLADNNLERRETLRALLSADGDIEVAGLARDGGETVRLAHSLRPDIVLVAACLAGRDGFAVAEMLTMSGLTLETILVSDDAETDLRRAMRAGAKEVIGSRCSPESPAAAVRSVHADAERRRSRLFASGTGGRVLAVSGAKGGIGKTTLAVNLAVALALEAGPTVLLDLYTQFGDAALLLNVSPRRTLADLVKSEAEDLDLRLLEDHFECHESGLRLLAGASVPLPLDSLTPALLQQILFLLRREGCFVVLDVPPVLHETTRSALSQADTVLLVANLFDLTTLADTRLWLDAVCGRDAAPDAVQIVLNRVSASNKLQIPDITRTLGRSVDCLVPNDGALVPASVNAGVPFVLSHPNSKIACSVFGLARSFHAPHG